MKKISILGISFALLFTFACNSPNNVSENKKNDSQVGSYDTKTDSIIAGDLGSVDGSDLQIRFDFGTGFETKASSSGTAAATVSDIQSAVLRLSTSNTDPLLASNLVFTSGTLTFTGSTRVYTFTNVPPGTYFATVELFSDAGATTNIIEPINYGGTTGSRGLTVSSNSSTVAVGSTFSFSDSSTSFKLAPALKNATGVTLEADVTPVNGNTTPSGVIGAF